MWRGLRPGADNDLHQRLMCLGFAQKPGHESSGFSSTWSPKFTLEGARRARKQLFKCERLAVRPGRRISKRPGLELRKTARKRRREKRAQEISV